MIPGLLILTALTPAAFSPPADSDVSPFVTEASQKTEVPESVIWAVISVESRGKLRAISPKGAMGLMQLMPGTWSHLTRQLDLGQDPFDPHDNIIAGTYYLRYLYDRYGWNGMFAAYNAGPGRYESFRDKRQTLPSETKAYIALIAKKLGGKSYAFTPMTVAKASALWTEAALFTAEADARQEAEPRIFSTATPFVDLVPPSSNAPQ
ncbi:lytic transglycosylase domain-containing protein [Asticcacaulis sp.]|uniref:lytic transglycosylase domain-containing protein n=1 Tax=Asticcacaulis sp. TaxID=1872648 RepID=UPI002BF01E4E|nr:lytic transglycosylase domain-containing protein [Asticcacaulis sp.]HTM82189.1 lytic transglycosylase domain-containing protein [Asticcacaulis sp.]